MEETPFTGKPQTSTQNKRHNLTQTLFPFGVIEEETTPEVKLEPLGDDAYQLSFTCVLIPRMPAHKLSGDIKNNLINWMGNLCLSFGWRGEFIIVEEEYLQWCVYVSPATPPWKIVNTAREHTSRLIFENYPRFKRQNLGKDFWATGHLVVTGMLPLAPQIVQDFINLVRRQQGA